jgi:hypothetical protein
MFRPLMGHHQVLTAVFITNPSYFTFYSDVKIIMLLFNFNLDFEDLVKSNIKNKNNLNIWIHIGYKYST